MSSLRVLVAGASIAGPMTAYWLARAGCTVTVIERFPELRKGGQNVDIRTGGVTVMRRTPGMEAAVLSKVPKWDGMQMVGPKGEPLFTMTATGDPDNQSLVSEYEIYRGDLSTILYDLTMQTGRVKYIFNEQITAIQHSEKHPDAPVTVSFANGTPSTEYDLVVAADGATSRTRAIGLNCGVRDHIHPINAWAAYFSTPKDLLEGSMLCKAKSSVGGRWLAIGKSPEGGNQIVMLGIQPKNQPDGTGKFREAQRKGDVALKSFVSEFFQSITSEWKGPEVLQALADSTDFYASESCQVKVPSLHHKRFVLVGDAGYATGPTGQGTSLALTGAYILAGEISSHKDHVAAGLRAYEERMKPIIKECQTIPPGIPQILAPQTEWGIWGRNLLFGLFTAVTK
ncbi:uncharacterized protein MYCFIDRAFT_190912 [Pseudocercospora fijiensis CIRAD86]|uniref:FAD-binding domain-containing protein n=1 Tax=Pseudocercospora fijiensis (strain CIRAD86) TaxID=383855 RepID=M2ZI01_PSEFD|nr:uncharacterized protein MYCFIDRAFT_190912 [Pseudocercospora fijiensis CIRAD86]EME78729.1 hypothetical protein MYCFIDRAFT_190912 [Pseudocercospora fijiensis CIRAD86]